MRYYDLVETPKTGKTFLEEGINRLPETDERVSVWFQPIDKIIYDRGFDVDGYPVLLEYELDAEGNRYLYYQNVMTNGVYLQDTVKKSEELEAQVKAEYKASRVQAVENIKVTTTAGNTFDGDETSQTRMVRAASLMDDVEVTNWALADNTVIEASKAELMEAAKLAGQEQTRLWIKE